MLAWTSGIKSVSREIMQTNVLILLKLFRPTQSEIRHIHICRHVLDECAEIYRGYLCDACVENL